MATTAAKTISETRRWVIGKLLSTDYLASCEAAHTALLPQIPGTCTPEVAHSSPHAGTGACSFSSCARRPWDLRSSLHTSGYRHCEVYSVPQRAARHYGSR